MKKQQGTHCLESLVTLVGTVGAEFRLGWFTCCSVLVSPAADVLEQKIKNTQIQEIKCWQQQVSFLKKSNNLSR